jgi:hypothetical protein
VLSVELPKPQHILVFRCCCCCCFLCSAGAAAAAGAAAGLVEEVLSVELPKPQHIRMGNWEQRPLSAEQQAYAALDAFASLLVHYEIEELPQRLTLRYEYMCHTVWRIVCATLYGIQYLPYCMA